MVEPITRSIKKWRNSSQRFYLAQLILDSCSIDRNQHSISRKEFLIDRDNEEFHHGVSTWLTQSVPNSSSINQKLHSIDRKESSINRNSHNRNFQNILDTVFDIFIVFYENTFWFYQWRFTDQALRFSISRSRTIIMLETLKT